MDVLIVFITIFSGIAIGAVIVILIKNRRKHMTKEHISDEETQLGIDEQYRRMYGDDLLPKN